MWKAQGPEASILVPSFVKCRRRIIETLQGVKERVHTQRSVCMQSSCTPKLFWLCVSEYVWAEREIGGEEEQRQQMAAR